MPQDVSADKFDKFHIWTISGLHASAKLQSILLVAGSSRGLANCLQVPWLPQEARGKLVQFLSVCLVIFNQAAEHSSNLLPAIALTTSKTKPTLCCRRSSCEKFCPAVQLGHSKARPLLGLLQGNLDKITERREMQGGILG